MTRYPMWCDDFDMDLLKVLPEAEQLLAPLAGIRLYTTCHPTYGRVNLPCSWNDRVNFCCFVGFIAEEDGLPAEGPQPLGYVTDAPVVEATAEELFRDLWSHQMRWVQMLTPHSSPGWPRSVEIWNSGQLASTFTDLMYDLRNWCRMRDEPRRRARSRALRSIALAAHRLQRVYQAWLDRREDEASLLALMMFDDEEEFDPDDEIEELIQACGQTSESACTLGGTEHCDFECP